MSPFPISVSLAILILIVLPFSFLILTLSFLKKHFDIDTKDLLAAGSSENRLDYLIDKVKEKRKLRIYKFLRLFMETWQEDKSEETGVKEAVVNKIQGFISRVLEADHADCCFNEEGLVLKVGKESGEGAMRQILQWNLAIELFPGYKKAIKTIRFEFWMHGKLLDLLSYQEVLI